MDFKRMLQGNRIRNLFKSVSAKRIDKFTDFFWIQYMID